MIWDVVIAGAGPAGSVAALVLARAGRRVLLLESGVGEERKVGESLPGAARPLLRDLGLLPLLERGGHALSYGNLSAWGSGELIAVDFIRDPNGPGWHLDRAKFDAGLREAALAAGAVAMRGRGSGAVRDGNRWMITSGGETIAARWMVDATGRRATLARSAGAVRRRDPHLVALYAWALSGTGNGDSRTLVESAPDGWWYTSRLPDGTRVVALHVDAGEAAPILRAPGAWEELLSRTIHVRRMLGDAVFPEAPRGTEACGARLDRFAGDGWLAVGDAALSFDPLSSQGIFNALYAGLRGGRAIDAALSGAPGAIASYTRRLEEIRAAYLRHHDLFYRSEERWSDRPFWRRRHGWQEKGERLEMVSLSGIGEPQEG